MAITKITTGGITDATIATADIAADAVTGAKIADDAVGAEHIEVLDAALQFGDSVKAQFGAGNDLEIYHSGSHSHITDAGTGGLKIRGSQVIIDDAAGDVLIQADQDGSVDLYYDGSNVCETMTNGIKLTDTELTEASDNFSINIQSGNNDFYVKSGGTTFAAFKGSAKDLQLTSGNLVIGTSGKGIDFSATSDVGGMSSELLDDYEEGSWTPDDLGGSAYNVATANPVGKYVKIGAVVHAWAQFGTDTAGNVAVGDRILIGDLPFNANGINNPAVTVTINYSGTTYSTAKAHVTSSNEIAFTVTQTTGHARSGSGYYVQVTYFTDS